MPLAGIDDYVARKAMAAASESPIRGIPARLEFSNPRS